MVAQALPPPVPAFEITVASQGMSKGLLQSDGPQFIPRASLKWRGFQLGGQWKNVSTNSAKGEASLIGGWSGKVGRHRAWRVDRLQEADLGDGLGQPPERRVLGQCGAQVRQARPQGQRGLQPRRFRRDQAFALCRRGAIDRPSAGDQGIGRDRPSLAQGRGRLHQLQCRAVAAGDQVPHRRCPGLFHRPQPAGRELRTAPGRVDQAVAVSVADSRQNWAFLLRERTAGAIEQEVHYP